MARRTTARAGMALILTLSVIALAGALAILLQTRAAARSRAEHEELLRERLRVAAAEAAREALQVLAADEDLQVDHLGEDWALPVESNHEDGVSTLAMIEDAGRFYNWNNLTATNPATRIPRDILLDLLTICGDFSPVVRVEALADYVDSDREGTYEDSFYGRLDPPYTPPHRMLWAPAELLGVHDFSAGMFVARPKTGTDDLFGGDLASATAVVPARIAAPIPVNINTASREVLMGLTGWQQDADVRRILGLRQIQPFESLGMLFAASPELAASLEGAIGTASTYYRVQARAAAGTQHRTVMAWVERGANGDIRILQWVEGEG